MKVPTTAIIFSAVVSTALSAVFAPPVRSGENNLTLYVEGVNFLPGKRRAISGGTLTICNRDPILHKYIFSNRTAGTPLEFGPSIGAKKCRSYPVPKVSRKTTISIYCEFHVNEVPIQIEIRPKGENDPETAGTGSGITVNSSKTAISGSFACRNGAKTEKNLWYIKNGSASPYYANSGYLCAKSGNGFFAKGSHLQHYSCSGNFTKCERHPSYDARLGKKIVGPFGRVSAQFIWNEGGRVDTLEKYQQK